MKQFYIDTSIWVDLYEDRIGYNGEPLGDYALKLFYFIRSKNHSLFISDLLIKELQTLYSSEQINGLINPFLDVVVRVKSDSDSVLKAKKLSLERNIPAGDALHALIAKKHSLTLISRDKHFKQLSDVCDCYKPEDII